MPELKAGPELDAAVAHALGFYPEDKEWWGRNRAGTKVHADCLLPLRLTAISVNQVSLLPKFSTDYTAAFCLFIEATERFGQVAISSDMEEWDAGHPVCVSIPEIYGVLWRPFPEAMCLAFLGALETLKWENNNAAQ